VRAGRRVPANAKRLAKETGSEVIRLGECELPTECVWITVPDEAISHIAEELAGKQEWKGKKVFHCSGALTSDVLWPLRDKGAKVASVHPGMTFPKGPAPSLKGVPFGVEGDAAALRLARRIITDLGGKAVALSKENKILYHAFDAFASPMVIALMAAMEEVGAAAGIAKKDLRQMAGPLLRQTVENYLRDGADKAFTGPFVRGDAEVIRRHLEVLKRMQSTQRLYVALAKIAVERLPVRNKSKIRTTIREAE